MNVDFVPFIRGVHVLCKPRLIFSRINGPIVAFLVFVHVTFKFRLSIHLWHAGCVYLCLQYLFTIKSPWIGCYFDTVFLIERLLSFKVNKLHKSHLFN